MSILTQFSLLNTFSGKIWLAQDSMQFGNPVLQLGFHLEQLATNWAEICIAVLKVPKREILDRSDFPDFYTIKPLRVGDFGVKIKKKI